jgi:ATP-dependent DNA helicase RecG
MRPSLLDPLFAPASALPGVGPKVGKLFDRLLASGEAGARVVDVLFHLPHGAIDRRNRPNIRDAPRDAVVTLEVTVAEHRPPASKRSRAPYRVVVEDGTGDVELVFFLAHHGWIEKALPIGARRWVSGKLELWDGHLQMVHPDRVLDAAGIEKMAAVEPVYGLTEGLSPRKSAGQGRRGGAEAPARELAGMAGRGAARGKALAVLRRGARRAACADDARGARARGPARARLAYDEMLANQLALVLVRAGMKRPAGRISAGDGRIAAKILAALPYELTGAQTQALAEIGADLASDRRMLRLLQGDVGSGKTIVALIAMAGAVEAGRQAALMAPTEILARQHFERIAPLAKAGGPAASR